MSIWFILIIVFLMLVFSSMIKIASQNERFVVFTLGRYRGLKGPGLILRFPGPESKWIKLSVGDRGELMAPDAGSFKNIQVPVQIDENVKVASIVRIIGFGADYIQVMPDPDQRRKIVCEKCGHEMTI